MTKPEKTEYNPYFKRYIDLVGDGVFLDILKQNTVQAADFFGQIAVEKHAYKYSPDKWTIKELLMHIIDMERVFAYRAWVCARGDSATPLPVIDENLYAANVDVSDRLMDDLITEFITVRRNSEYIFAHISERQSKFVGNSEPHSITARAVGYIMIGHVLHHLNILKERYL